MRFKSIYFRVVKGKKLRFVFLLVLILAVFGLIYIRGAVGSLAGTQSRADFLREHPAAQKLLPLYRSVRKLSDLTYLPYIFKKDELPAYRLAITEENQRILNDNLPKEFQGVIYTDKVYVPAKFYYQDKEYDVEVRHRGDTAVHWNAPKKSYQIRFDKDEPFGSAQGGFRELSLIIVDDRKFALEQMNNYRADKLGLLRSPSFFANLSINDKKQGLYFVLEGWSREMLSKWEVPDESNLYGDADVGFSWDNLSGWTLKAADSQFSYEHFSEAEKLLELLAESDDERFFARIFDLIDKQSFYSWQIQSQLANSVHQNTGNMTFYFDDSAGKFYFIPWELNVGSISEDNFTNYGPLARRIFSNPVFFHEKNKLLYEYLSHEENLEDDLRFYDETYESIKPALYRDRLKVYTNRWADKVHRENRENIAAIFNRLKDKFEQSSVLAEVAVNNDDTLGFGSAKLLAEIDLTFQSIPEFYLTAAEPKFTEGQSSAQYQIYYDANLNGRFDRDDLSANESRNVLLFSRQKVNQETGRLEPQATTHRFYLMSGNIRSSEFAGKLKSVKVELENAITGEKLKNKNIELKLINRNAFQYFENISDVGLFERENPIFRVNRQTREISLPAGSYRIDKTIVVPKGFTLKLNPGTALRFAPGVSLLSYSPVEALGTRARPISFTASGASPWGVFAVLGAHAESVFRNANFIGGSDDYINGVYFSGMLSAYHSDARVENSTFTDARADDALNVKSAKGVVLASRFIGNSFDAVDFDFVKIGEISSSEFSGNGNDGIDFSGSSVLVRDNYIEQSGDKCVSIGESSRGLVVYNNVLNACRVGVEVKDGSGVKIINNVIVGNEVGLSAYVKKPIFSGGRTEVYNSIIWDNGEAVTEADGEKIEVHSSVLQGSSGENGNFSAAPEFRSSTARDFTIAPAADKMMFINGGDASVLLTELGIEIDSAPIGLIREIN